MERQGIGRNEVRTGKLTALIARVREKSNPQEFTALGGETRLGARGLGHFLFFLITPSSWRRVIRTAKEAVTRNRPRIGVTPVTGFVGRD